MRLLRRPEFAASIAVMGLVGLVMYGQTTSLPVIGLDQHGLHGLDQGLLVCALGLGLLVSMPTGGRISDRLGARSLVRAGAAVTAALLATFAASADHLPLAAACVLFVAVGLSFGLTASPTVASLYRTLMSNRRHIRRVLPSVHAGLGRGGRGAHRRGAAPGPRRGGIRRRCRR
nr:MFS transporter [Frankia tisae]